MTKLTRAALRRKKPVTDELLIPADDAQQLLLEDARSGLQNAEQGLSLSQIAGQTEEADAQKRVDEARTKLEEAKAAIRKTGLSIVLVSAGQERYDEALLACPPTAEQKEKAEKDGEDEPLYDPKIFWPTLVAASVPDSDLTPEDWRREVFESKSWGPAELSELRDRTLNLYQSSRILSLGN